MNQQQAKEWQGKHVKWDYWHDADNKASLSGGSVIHAKEVVGTIWILHKLTKSGLCMIGSNGSIETISVAPGCLSQWEDKV